MTPRPPTPQGISALLRKAGFKRSDYGKPGVMWNMAMPGYSVWRTFHAGNPDQLYVAVQYVVGESSAACTDEEWLGHLKECRAHLEEYAAAIRKAGYHPLVRDRGKEPPWLTILTAAKAQDQ